MNLQDSGATRGDCAAVSPDAIVETGVPSGVPTSAKLRVCGSFDPVPVLDRDGSLQLFLLRLRDRAEEVQSSQFLHPVDRYHEGPQIGRTALVR